MSTDYLTAQQISAAHLFDGRLTDYGVYEHFVEPDPGRAVATTASSRCLTDGRNYLWVAIGDVHYTSKPRPVLDAVVRGSLVHCHPTAGPVSLYIAVLPVVFQ